MVDEALILEFLDTKHIDLDEWTDWLQQKRKKPTREDKTKQIIKNLRSDDIYASLVDLTKFCKYIPCGEVFRVHPWLKPPLSYRVYQELNRIMAKLGFARVTTMRDKDGKIARGWKRVDA